MTLWDIASHSEFSLQFFFNPVFVMKNTLYTTVIIFLLAGCSPEIGSDEWCASMKDKPTGDWTQNETKEYAKNCIFIFGDK